MSDHTCPAPGCAVDVPRHRLACAAHWYQLPLDMRREIYRAYRAAGMGSDEHTDAILAAVSYWREAT